MDPISKAIEALEPFADQNRSGPPDMNNEYVNAAKALAALRDWQAEGEVLKPPYWRCRCGTVAMPLTDDTSCLCTDIYDQDWMLVEPGAIAGIPAEIRERCLEALRFYLKKYPDPSYAAASEWLKGEVN